MEISKILVWFVVCIWFIYFDYVGVNIIVWWKGEVVCREVRFG